MYLLNVCQGGRSASTSTPYNFGKSFPSGLPKQTTPKADQKTGEWAKLVFWDIMARDVDTYIMFFTSKLICV